MIPRYTPPEIAAIFSDESRLGRWLQVELLACEAWAELGRIPTEAVPAVRRATVDPHRIAQLEAEQGHDVAAFVAAVQETVGEAGRYIHLGLTSSDVVDTALATQLRDAAAIIDADAATRRGVVVCWIACRACTRKRLSAWAVTPRTSRSVRNSTLREMGIRW